MPFVNFDIRRHWCHFGATDFPAETIPGTSVAVAAGYRDTLTEDLVRQAVRLQNRNIPILITGESGVGKERLMRLVHSTGCRRHGPLVAISCASIPRDLIESELFHSHSWPGNIRELRSLLSNLVSMATGEVLTVRDLPEDFLEEMRLAEPGAVGAPRVEAVGTLAVQPGTAPSVEDRECLAIESALRQTGGNVAETARVLGISRSTLYVKLQRYNLVPDRRGR